MGETLDYLRTFAQFPFSLRRFLKRTWTLEEARQAVREQMEQREASFLSMAENSIYGHATSPYLPLLRLAGCELGDLRAAVRRAGVEGALRELLNAGVFVSYEEFKGRKPIVRQGKTFAVASRDFDNPFMQRDFALTTGGSTGAAVGVGMDLDHIAAGGSHEMLGLSAHGLLDSQWVFWQGPLPDVAFRHVLRLASFGQPVSRWFSPIGLRDSRQWVKYGLASHYILLCMRLSGLRVPWPRYVPVERAEIVARSLAGIVGGGGKCVLYTSVSRALRIALAAQAAGTYLRGAAALGIGEPVTPAKLERITSAGMRFTSVYSTVEAGRVAWGCAAPVDSDDVHLLRDAFALFTQPHTVEGWGVTVDAFNLTALSAATPKVMLNVQMDDYGIVEERHCGCELEAYGYTTHLRQIRSYSKLTGEGVTLIGSEVVRILEEVLPARFGGSPLDYQLLEQEDEQGLTRLYLVVSPRVHIADESEVVRALMDGLSASSSMADAVRTFWKRTQTVQVKRMEPALTSRGKLNPLSLQRQPAAARPQR